MVCYDRYSYLAGRDIYRDDGAGQAKNISFQAQKLETKPSEEWVQVEVTHEVIIGKADFDLVQKLRRLVNRTAPNTDKVHLFSDVLVCDRCGS